MDYTTVVGVDTKTLSQLRLTWPTWCKHKPSLMDHPMIIFYDKTQLEIEHVFNIVDHPNLTVLAWPDDDKEFAGDGQSKWSNPQRHKMLAGFVHLAARAVHTDYWLKLDTDIVATGNNDWVDDRWFMDNPQIVAPPWGYTKPADQMYQLDLWVEKNKNKLTELWSHDPLYMMPSIEAKKLSHKRICSWCGFFGKLLTTYCAFAAAETVGQQLPVPSQDGYMHYVAERLKLRISRVAMKKFGWKVCSSMGSIKTNAETALQ